LSGSARSLFVFAHQDDEFAAAPWIVQELREGAAVACVYLTDGGSRTPPAVRDAESRDALHSLRVDDNAIAFLQIAGGRIADGALPAASLDALAALAAWVEAAAFVPSRIYAPSYEGGHPDHDAAHLIAAAFARQHDLVEEAWHFSLYHAYRIPRPFFACFAQLPSAMPSRRARLSARDRVALTLLCTRYRSQRRTWIGLLPGALLQRLLLGRERVVRFDLARLTDRPHPGQLLYERLFNVPYTTFANNLTPLNAHLNPAPAKNAPPP
jgi:LmbE family N-acetylglucosaminyl deacetylase